jgi:hypothetical protein
VRSRSLVVLVVPKALPVVAVPLVLVVSRSAVVLELVPVLP